MPKLDLADNFNAARHEDWQKLVEKGLKGADFESLAKHSEDGFVRGPLSTESDRPQNIAPMPRAGAPLLDGRPWHICAPVRDSELSFANTQMLNDLNGGASAVRIRLGEGGIAVKHASDIKRLLEQVYTDLIPITLAPNNNIGNACLLYTSPSPRDGLLSRMPSSA